MSETYNVTHSFQEFSDEATKANEFVLFAFIVASGGKQVLKYIRDEVATSSDPEWAELAPGLERVLDTENKDNKSILATSPEAFERFAGHLIISKIVDNFNTYLADVLRQVFLIKPEILKGSGISIQARDVLDHESISALVQSIANRKVDNLSGSGFEKIVDYLQSIGVEPDISADANKRITEAIAVRNLVVHNRGRVDKTFQIKANRHDLQVGQTIDYDLEAIYEMWASVVDVAYQIDVSLTAKYAELSTQKPV